jgi:signal transduction histidine kinase
MNVRTINQLLEVSSEDPEDARRRRLLNILLFGVAVLTILTLIALIVVSLVGTAGTAREVYQLSIGISALLFGFLIIFFVNRYWSGEVAGSFFLLLLVAVFAFSDTPQQIVQGRSLFLFTIPILMASVILRPWASFLMAGVCSTLIGAMDIFILQNPPGVPTMLGFFAVALVSWLSARSLENALADLRIINEELDQRVIARTHELAQANAELEAANERLKELDRLKSRFVSMVSHELRTPLNAIQGFAEMIEAGIYGPVEEKQENALDRIIANAKRLLGIVNELLDQARMEAGQVVLKITSFSPAELTDDFHSTMDVLAENKGLTLTTEVTPDVPAMLHGDRERLHQIVVNLVNNALKFTEEGGIHMRLHRPDVEHWAIDVTDTGTGIPKDAQAYIFEPFRQVDGSETRTHKGVGLGLSIVKQLTELMGGEITIESEVGQGSTFTVVLPLTPPQTKK